MSVTGDSSAVLGTNALRACWDALGVDAEFSVIVLDASARILYGNVHGAVLLGRTPESLGGAQLTDVCAGAMGEERAALIRRAAVTGVPITMDFTWLGRARRTVLRPFKADDGSTQVLMVCRWLNVGATPVPAGMEYIRAKANDLGRLSVLTPRELEILTLIAQGLSTSEIAKHLHRSEKTIEWHRVSLGAKLGVLNRVELTWIAIEAGLVASSAAASDASSEIGRDR